MQPTIARLFNTAGPRFRPVQSLVRHAAQLPPNPPSNRPQPTVFSNKSSPQQIHDRPEMIRGMPAGKSTPSWAKGGGPIPAYIKTERGDDFAGPSRPRMVYERPGEKDLPKLKVSRRVSSVKLELLLMFRAASLLVRFLVCSKSPCT
jgi:hypothetical protein